MITRMTVQTRNIVCMVTCAAILFFVVLSPVAAQTAPTLTISRIEFVGNSLVSDDDLNQKLSSFFVRSLEMKDIDAIVSQVGFAYREYGHWAGGVLARANYRQRRPYGRCNRGKNRKLLSAI